MKKAEISRIRDYADRFRRNNETVVKSIHKTRWARHASMLSGFLSLFSGGVEAAEDRFITQAEEISVLLGMLYGALQALDAQGDIENKYTKTYAELEYQKRLNKELRDVSAQLSADVLSFVKLKNISPEEAAQFGFGRLVGEGEDLAIDPFDFSDLRDVMQSGDNQRATVAKYRLLKARVRQFSDAFRSCMHELDILRGRNMITATEFRSIMRATDEIRRINGVARGPVEAEG